MYYVYILYSEKINRYYVGYSHDPELRLSSRHNMGYVKATRNGRPYRLICRKGFDTESEARIEEHRIKKKKSRKYIEYLIDGNW